MFVLNRIRVIGRDRFVLLESGCGGWTLTITGRYYNRLVYAPFAAYDATTTAVWSLKYIYTSIGRVSAIKTRRWWGTNFSVVRECRRANQSSQRIRPKSAAVAMSKKTTIRQLWFRWVGQSKPAGAFTSVGRRWKGMNRTSRHSRRIFFSIFLTWPGTVFHSYCYVEMGSSSHPLQNSSQRPAWSLVRARLSLRACNFHIYLHKFHSLWVKGQFSTAAAGLL